jgi:glyoxylate/hydroxypyruvate reductase A
VQVLGNSIENDNVPKYEVPLFPDKCPTLINIGRSNIISESDLISALDAGWIKSAVLDVLDPEPLPDGHPFWSHPGVEVTPHVAAFSRAEEIAKCFKANYERHLAGEALEPTVNWGNLY